MPSSGVIAQCCWGAFASDQMFEVASLLRDSPPTVAAIEQGGQFLKRLLADPASAPVEDGPSAY